jgi:uncharacterized protein YwqG
MACAGSECEPQERLRLNMKVITMKKHLCKAGYAEYADLIESQAQRCVRFSLIPRDDREIAVEQTKLGGSPVLPVRTPWPLRGDRPLTFLAQINLRDLNPYPICRTLPSEGILYFFLDMDSWSEEYDPSDRENWRVIFHDGPLEELERRVLPERELSPPRFNPCWLVPHEALSPGWYEKPIQAFHLDEAQEDEYVHIIYEFPDEKAHQVLGRPGRIENLEYELQLQCQAISHGLALGADGRPLDKDRAKELAPGADDWKLLLQLDSDEGAGMDWGDSMISFWIRERDLQERNFSEVWQIDERF